MRLVLSSILPATLLLAVSACGGEEKKTEAVEPAAEQHTLKTPVFNQLARADFNRIAVERALPLFWTADKNTNNAIDPDELVVLWGVAKPGTSEATLAYWVNGGAFTPGFISAYAEMQKPADLSALPPAEKARRETVMKELSFGQPAAVVSDFKSATPEDRAVVEGIQKAAALVEKIYAMQTGAWGLDSQIPADDTVSRALFFRNQSTSCAAAQTEKDERCAGLATKEKPKSGIYPKELQGDAGFCKVLEKRKDADALLDPFVVVRAAAGTTPTGDATKDALEAVPYTVAFKDDMAAISKILSDTANAVVDPKETAFKAYLLAASASFLSNDWKPADEAWAKMSVDNSKWYLRIGPDEVYFEPCSRKAGFHTSFARINQDSVEWQKKLDPLKGEMEQELARLAGKPYTARDVKVHLPDFIDMILNAGDSRDSHGATVGQSLPNWGPVANEGRGRTVAMTNLYTDPDSEANWTKSVSSLLCKDAMDKATFDPTLSVMSSLLHEAAHNLGPAHEYKVGGKTAAQAFGGELASMLEELKAQTSALYLADWLAGKNVIAKERAERAHIRDVTWAFGHIAQGMVDANGKSKPYSQLASIEMGTLNAAGVLAWDKEAMAANGTDKGCFQVDLQKWSPTVLELEKAVLGIKARGDKPTAEKLKKEFVLDEGAWGELRTTIRERWLRQPKTSFYYAIAL